MPSTYPAENASFSVVGRWTLLGLLWGIGHKLGTALRLNSNIQIDPFWKNAQLICKICLANAKTMTYKVASRGIFPQSLGCEGL
jgi:hypothetical protein